MKLAAYPGPSDDFCDVAGVRVGHAEHGSARTGVSVIIPDRAAPMAADVRGGGPGVRETDALAPHCLVEGAHAIVLSGGSVFGLAAADALAEALSRDGKGLDLGPHPIPIVPAAVLFDLRNGGDKTWDTPPYRRLAQQAYSALSGRCGNGPIGAGAGATSGDRPGGVGTASLTTDSGLVVSAMVAVNSFGVVEDTASAVPGTLTLPKAGLIAGNTTIGVVATNLALDKAGCQRLAIMGQDGLARAIRPVHTPFDGDTLFALSTGALPPEGPLASALMVAGALAADCVQVACRRAVGDA